MKCVFCNCSESKVVDSRYLKDTAIRRRRECINCGKRFTTYETVETNPMIVTNVNNEREPFKIEKLIESLKYATYCRDNIAVDFLAQKIEKALLMLNSQEISTKDIVVKAVDVLMELDTISALVYYTQHTDCKSFEDVNRFING
ncbi:MAG: transcriptional repressor NrdR [Clostridia bacterium]|nr:transcriptional repressor NrdR [Clostridia bacterium]